MGFHTCAVPCCQDKYSPRHLFPHPVEEKTRFDRWIQLVNNPKLFELDPLIVYYNYQVCHIHFKPEDLSTKNRIIKTSLPALNLNSGTSNALTITNDAVFDDIVDDNHATRIQHCITCWTEINNNYFDVKEKCYSDKCIKEVIIGLIPRMTNAIQETDRICNNCKKTLDNFVRFIDECILVQAQLKPEDSKKINEDPNNIIAKKQIQNIENVSIPNNRKEQYQEEQETHDLTQDDESDVSVLIEDEEQEIYVTTEDNVETSLNIPINDEEQCQEEQEIYDLTEDDVQSPVSTSINSKQQVQAEQKTFDKSQEVQNQPDNEKNNSETKKHVLPVDVLISKNAYNIKDFGIPNRVISVAQSDLKSIESLVDMCKQQNISVYDESGNCSKRVLLLGSLLVDKCMLCESTFNSKKELQSHKFSDCMDSYTYKNLGLRSPIRYKCVECSCRFHKYRDYAEHIKIFHPVKCKLCDAVFENKEKYIKHYDKYHVPKKTENFLCDVCGKQFNLNHRFTSHKRVHNINKTYMCEICGLSFDNKNKWITHRWTHAEKKLKCDRCNKEFANNIKLSQHIRRVHYPEENNMRFQCEECGKLLKSKITLHSHMRLVHSTLGPYQCPNCPKVFSASFYLWRHMKKTCKKPGKVRKSHNQYAIQCCKICGKYYKGSGNLKLHEKSHFLKRRWACNKCGITLKNFQTLKKHEKTHMDGENMHRCNVCWKKFETVENLEEHMILHDRPRHQCEECGETFHRKFLLDNHILLDHSTPEYVEYSPSTKYTEAIDENEKVIVVSNEV